MKAALFHGANDIRVGELPDPVVQEPTDAVVRVVRGCVCGSDLWYYRGINQHAVGSIGHEFIGVVDSVGDDVGDLSVGDFVIAPFTYNDGTCPACLHGYQSNCVHGGGFGNGTIDGGQGEYVRVPFAGSTLVTVPGKNFTDEQLASFTALSDVMCTGYHAARSAGVKPGDVVAVVGDGAVGLSGVLGAQLLGATRIIALSRHADRQAVAKEFGATDIVSERGDAAVAAVLGLTDGVGVDAALECVGTDESIETAAAITRAGGMIGAVGVPLYQKFQYRTLFWKNIGIKGGVAPARQYIPELLEKVLSGDINPGLVFTLTTDLDHVADGYAAMDERRAIKALVAVSDEQGTAAGPEAAQDSVSG